VLYLRYSHTEASPKAISGRTSYLLVRLAFHPYPHLIRLLFNEGRFEPPLYFTKASLWTWVDHQVSGLLQRTLRPIKTRFRFGSGFSALTCTLDVTRRSVLQKVRRHTSVVCRQAAVVRFACISFGSFYSLTPKPYFHPDV